MDSRPKYEVNFDATGFDPPKEGMTVWHGFDYGVGQAPEDDDGLGACRGVWYAVKVLLGALTFAWWAIRSVALWRAGELEPFFVGTCFLGGFVLMARHLDTSWPKNKWIAMGFGAIAPTLGVVFLR